MYQTAEDCDTPLINCPLLTSDLYQTAEDCDTPLINCPLLTSDLYQIREVIRDVTITHRILVRALMGSAAPDVLFPWKRNISDVFYRDGVRKLSLEHGVRAHDTSGRCGPSRQVYI